MDLRKDTEESEDFEEGRMDVSDGPEGVEAPLDETDPSETDPSENSFPPSRPIAEDTGGLNFALSEEDMAKLQHHANQDLSSSLSSSSNSKKITLNIPHEATSTSLLETPSAAAATPQSTSIPLVTPIFACDRTPESYVGNCSILKSLCSCSASVNPLPIISSMREDLYGLPSMVKRLVLEKRLREHEGCVNCINFSWRGDILASGSDDLHVVLWDWRKGRMATKFETGHVANVFQAKFMPHNDDTVLVTASRDGQVRCHTLTSTGELHHSSTVGNHSDSAHKLSIEPDSKYMLLSSGEDGSVLQIDLRESNTRNKILVCKNEKNRKIPLYSIFIDPSDKNYFAVSGQNQFARIYDRRLLQTAREEPSSRTCDPVKTYCPDHLLSPSSEIRRANITCLVYSHDGSHLLCSYNDEDIYLFDARHSSGSNYVRKYSGHRNNATVKGVNFFGLRSEYVVSGSDCGHVFLWDTDKQDIVQCMEGDMEGVVNCLEPHPHIPVLATSGLDHDVKIFTPTAVRPTSLDGVDTVVERNKTRREEAWTYSSTRGLGPFAELFLEHYRRGLREANDDSDDSFTDTPPSEREGGDEDDEDGENEGRCIQQ